MTKKSIYMYRGEMLSQSITGNGEDKKTYLRQLVERAQTGDRDAFDELYRTKLRQIFSNINAYISNPADADDVAQEIGVIVYANLPKLKDPDAFNAWLGRIITNTCYKAIGKNADHDRVQDIDDYADSLYEEKKEFLPEEYAENEALREVILKAIGTLSAQRKRMVIMYFYEDMKYKEIAIAMGLSVSAVSTGIMKAKRLIKEEIKVAIANEPSIGRLIPTGTVVGAALEYEAILLCPDARMESILGGLSDKLANVTPGQKGSSHSSRGDVLQLVKAAVVSTAAVITLTAIGINMVGTPQLPAETERPAAVEQAADPEQYDIAFVGGQCDCGHLNPKDATVAGSGQITNVTWKILSADGENAIAEGSEESIAERLLDLQDKKLDGDYVLSYNFEGANDFVYTLTRPFTINTGLIEPGQYL